MTRRLLSVLLLLSASCAETDPSSPPDCDALAAHVADLRVESRVARAPERDRDQHRAALIRALGPELRAACAGMTDDERTCRYGATTLEDLTRCTSETSR